MRVLVFGDSITQGFWDTEGGWAGRLRKYYDERQLRDVENNDEPTIFNLGISGDVSAGLLNRIENETYARKWRWPREDFAYIIATGTNDSLLEDGKARTSPEEYSANIKAIIEKAKLFSDKILCIGLLPVEEEHTTPRPNRTIYYTNERIQFFDKLLKNSAMANGAKYLPIFDSFQEKIQSEKELFSDGLHPNNEGHEFIFKLVQPELDSVLNT